MSAEWVRVDLDAVEKFGADAAVVLGLIAYRCNLTGEWSATVDTLVEETRLTAHRVRAALRVLRDTGEVTSRRANPFYPTLTWSVSPGHTENQESLITRDRIPSLPETQESAFTSSREDEELPLVVPDAQPSKTKATTPRRATRLPEGFGPSPQHFALAASLGVDLRIEGPQFVDHHTAKGSTFKDWDAALRTWIRNAAKYASHNGTDLGAAMAGRNVHLDTTYDPSYEATLPPPATEPRSWAGWR